MKNVIKSPGGRVFAVDSEKRTLEFSGCSWQKEIPFAEFMRFSGSAPWDFPAAEYDRFRVTPVPGDTTMLVAAAENDELLCGIAFNFDGELLKGDLLVSFKKDSAKNYAILALPVENESVVTLPGVVYNNNPAVLHMDNVAHFPPRGEASLVVEESRLPITGVNAEKDNKFISLFSVQEMEHEWTMGPHRDNSGKDWLILSSGCLSFNGVKDRIYIGKRCTADNRGIYRNFRAGDKLCKRFAVSWGETPQEGHGFRDLVRSGYELLMPAAEGAISRDEVIDLKMTALEERWAGDGYLCTMPDNIYNRKPVFLWGWVGQSFRLALCDMRNALLKNEKEGIERMYKCVEFFIKNSKTEVPGLHYNHFNLENFTWHGDTLEGKPCIASRSLGETWTDLARIIQCCRENGLPEPVGALDTLREGLEFILNHRLTGGAVPFMWFPDGTPASQEISCAGSSVLPAFFEYYRLTGDEKWCSYAEEMLDIFYQIGGDTFKTPFSHATLDAECEDKEACIPFFVGAATAYEITGEEKFRHYAEVAADWLLTWVYFHEVPLRKGSICELNGFRTTGWPSVSVEHHHLDVFFPAWELYKFGKATGNPVYRNMGKNVFKAWSHGISRGNTHWFFQNPGRQAEQFFQTEWFFTDNGEWHWNMYNHTIRYQMKRMGYNAENLPALQRRGGSNPWDVAWIIALVLDAALGFEEEERKAKV